MTKILIVDDEENIRFSFSMILTDAGYEVIESGSLMDAKLILASNQFDVAIVDRLLESHNGMDLVDCINKMQPFCTTIFISAFPDFKSASEGFKHRLFAYLQKPVKKNELLLVVEGAMQKTREKQISHEYEQQLIQAQKMTTIGMLSGGVVHDLNNLMMTITGVAELSCLDLPVESHVCRNLKHILTVTRQGSKLSKQLLSYIRQSNGISEHVRIQPLIKETLALLKIIMARTLKIKDNICAGNEIVLVHPIQIQQVIINLGINAMHAMENKNGTLDVGLESIQLDAESMASLGMKKQDCIKISMEDTGCGMDKKMLKQIFEPFFSTRPKSIGTGLGLSITHTILKNHGGVITAKSRPGKGSRFDIYLPIVKSHKIFNNRRRKR